MTGFEPRVLKDYYAPISVNAKGIAGIGLFESNFAERQVYSGQQGEVGFYKTLCKSNMVDCFSTYWSVAIPAADGQGKADPKYSSDVDCIIVQGKYIYLIDLKYYTSGDVTWYTEGNQFLLCRDNANGTRIGSPRKMSRNMALAADRYRILFPQLELESYVVLIPTNSGAATVHPGTEWPGGVPLINLTDIVDLLRSRGTAFADTHTDNLLSGLLKL